MGQYQITSICHRTISITNCAEKGASLIIKQRVGNKNMCIICFNIKVT